MSVRRKSASTRGYKPKEEKNIAGARTESEVKVLKKCNETSNKNEFAEITRKHSSGATNWAKFAKVLEQKKVSQSNNKVLSNKKNVSLKFPNKMECKKTLKDQQQYLCKTPIVTIPSKDISSKNVHGTNSEATNSKSEICKPNLTKHIAMDCEMVGVEIGVSKSMLARISLVNSHGDCIYDKYVKPTEPVLDYRTRVSGIRPKDLENATDFKVIQNDVADILKGRILVGHALKNDLKVLYLSHPKHSIRDTSKFRKFRQGKAPALKKLAKQYLGVTIQDGEHSSVQDALAAMQLYKMFKKEWESSIFSKKRPVQTSAKSEPSLSFLNKSAQDV